jgi:hypothetical protein
MRGKFALLGAACFGLLYLIQYVILGPYGRWLASLGVSDAF